MSEKKAEIVHFDVRNSGDASKVPICNPDPVTKILERAVGDMAQVTCVACKYAVAKLDAAEFQRQIADLTRRNERQVEFLRDRTIERDAAQAGWSSASQVVERTVTALNAAQAERDDLATRLEALRVDVATVFNAIPLGERVTIAKEDGPTDSINGAKTLIATIKRLLIQRDEARAAVDQQAGFREAAERAYQRAEQERKDAQASAESNLEAVRSLTNERDHWHGVASTAAMQNEEQTKALEAVRVDLALAQDHAKVYRKRARAVARELARERSLTETLAHALDVALAPPIVVPAGWKNSIPKADKAEGKPTP